jgi:hypothetical protein
VSTHATTWTPGEIYYTFSSRVDTKASKRKKRVIPDEDAKLLLECRDSDLNSVDSEVDIDHSVDDIAVVDMIVNDADDDNEAEAASAGTFVWEDVANCEGQREQFRGGFGPQGAAKEFQEIGESFELFLNQEFVHKIAEETNCYAVQFQNSQGRLFARRSTVHAWKPATFEEIYILLGLFMLMCIIQKPSLQSYFSTKRAIATLCFGDIITRERLELLCKFLHFSDSESQDSYQGPPKLFRIFPIIFHLNSKFQTLYLRYQNISVDESQILWMCHLSFKQYFPLKSS